MSISRDSVYDHAIAHVYNAIEISGGLWIMRNHHNGLAKIFIQPTQHLEHDVGIFCIQITSWFVGKQDFWISDNGASDGDALLFAPGHFGGQTELFESVDCDPIHAPDSARADDRDVDADVALVVLGDGSEDSRVFGQVLELELRRLDVDPLDEPHVRAKIGERTRIAQRSP